MLTVSKPPSTSRVTVKPSLVFSSLDANVAYNNNTWQPDKLNVLTHAIYLTLTLISKMAN